MIRPLKIALSNICPPIILTKYLKWKSSPIRFRKDSLIEIANFPFDFKVIEFSLIGLDSKYDLKWGWWSRIFEYELITSKLKLLGATKSASIHNTCWGYQGCHILFKEELEERFGEVVNTDITKSQVVNTEILDLSKQVPNKFKSRFDFTINVSTLEEIPASHIKVFSNMLSMTKPKGYVIATFDLPGLQLEMFEKLFERKIGLVAMPVNGRNSPYRMDFYEDLTVGYFIVQRV